MPDLIAILDTESAEPLTAERLAYGQRVRVIGYSAAPIMRRAECLKVFGPRLFGLDEDFRPVEELTTGGGRLCAEIGQILRCKKGDSERSAISVSLNSLRRT